MGVIRVINLAVRFCLEVAALAAVAYWAVHVDAPRPLRIILAIFTPIVVAIFWGLFVAPKARFSTGRIGQVWLGLVVFLAAAVALAARGQFALGVVFACTAVVSSALLYLLP